VRFYFTIRNQGSASVSADCDHGLYVDGVSTVEGTDTDRLASGTSDIWYWDTTWPSDTASHTFMVVVDLNNGITEGDESNNSASISASAAPAMYTLTPSAGIGGTNTPQTVLRGGSKSFTIAPNAGYHIANVAVD